MLEKTRISTKFLQIYHHIQSKLKLKLKSKNGKEEEEEEEENFHEVETVDEMADANREKEAKQFPNPRRGSIVKKGREMRARSKFMQAGKKGSAR